MILETERLLLRPITMEDAVDVYEYSKGAEVGPNAGGKPHADLEETKEILNTVFIGQEGVFGIVWKENGKMIGSVGLIQDPKRENPGSRMLGYAISREYWGRGIMTESVKAVICFGFDIMQLDLISAYCYPANERSRHVLKKCGFEYEGMLKQCELCYDGTIRDNECYALFKERE